MRKRRCSTFEIMFKTKLLEEKEKPVRERRVLFPFGYAANDNSGLVVDISAYREEFERTDTNDDGYIDEQEFGRFLRSIGLNPTDKEVKELFNKMDKDQSGMIEFEEFIHILDHPMIKLSKNEIHSTLSECFKKIVPRSNTKMNENVASFMSLAHFKRIMTEKGRMKLSDEQFSDLMSRTPLTHQMAGVVNYKTIIELFIKDFEEVNIIRKSYKITHYKSNLHILKQFL